MSLFVVGGVVPFLFRKVSENARNTPKMNTTHIWNEDKKTKEKQKEE